MERREILRSRVRCRCRYCAYDDDMIMNIIITCISESLTRMDVRVCVCVTCAVASRTARCLRARSSSSSSSCTGCMLAVNAPGLGWRQVGIGSRGGGGVATASWCVAADNDSLINDVTVGYTTDCMMYDVCSTSPMTVHRWQRYVIYWDRSWHSRTHSLRSLSCNYRPLICRQLQNYLKYSTKPSTSFWYQFFHFRLTYSFTHNFFPFWFTTLVIHNSLSLSFTPA